MTDRLTGEITDIVIFVAILPYSQKIYAEGIPIRCLGDLQLRRLADCYSRLAMKYKMENHDLSDKYRQESEKRN